MCITSVRKKISKTVNQSYFVSFVYDNDVFYDDIISKYIFFFQKGGAGYLVYRRLPKTNTLKRTPTSHARVYSGRVSPPTGKVRVKTKS